MLNVLFMGTPDFAAESLKCLTQENYNIIGVVTNPDRPKGRGMKMIASPVKEYAISKDIPVYQPLKVKIKAVELLAQALSHEIDHLNGITFVDRMEPGTLEYVNPEK